MGQVAYASDREDLRFTDASGKVLDAQYKDGVFTVQCDGLKAIGLNPIYVLKLKDGLEKNALIVEEKHEGDSLIQVEAEGESYRIRTQFYEMNLDRYGHIRNLYDLESKRELIKAEASANQFIVFDDRPHKWEAWDVNIHYQEKSWIIDDLISLEVSENGPVRAVISMVKQYKNSVIRQNMIFRKDDRIIEFDTSVDWQEKNTLLKVAFPLDIHTDKAQYDIQFGNVSRSTHWNTSWDLAKFEVCAHKWADISETDYGCTLLNDSKYGYDIKDSVMRLSLIKSPTWPYDGSDIGAHHFRYGLYPHKGNWADGQVVQKGYDFNKELYSVTWRGQEAADRETIDVIKNDGPSKEAAALIDGLVTLDNDNIVIEAIKRSEDGMGYIIRLYECENRRSLMGLSFTKDIACVYETNMEEKVVKPLAVINNKILKEVKPYEILTLKILVS